MKEAGQTQSIVLLGSYNLSRFGTGCWFQTRWCLVLYGDLAAVNGHKHGPDLTGPLLNQHHNGDW
jgi:hypothetical protein